MFRLLHVVLVLAATTGCAGYAQAAKVVLVGKQATASERVSIDQIQHTAWTQLLKKHVDQDGRVDYRAWKASKSDMRELDDYLAHLSTAKLEVEAKRKAKLAYWINAYNAVTVHGILREYPTKSIRNHTSRFGGYNIWHHYQLQVGGKGYSLDDMEHQILRKMDEPRIHFAIVCASVGCPRLLAEAYEPERLDEQLTVNAKDFFSRKQNFRYDAGKKTFYLSAILDWFGEGLWSQARRPTEIDR